MKRLALALGCAAIALTATAAAHTSRDRTVVRHHPGPMAEIDANADGWITRAEASAAAERAFAELDSDNDGRLTAEDRQRHTMEFHLDGDVDLEIRRAEREVERAERHAERARRHAERAERDSERHVERRVERNVDRREERTVIITHGDDSDLPTPPTPPVAPTPPRPPMFVMVFANSEEADLNGDGGLSLEEFRAQHLRFFDASDANGDGRIRFEPPPAPPESPEPPTPPTPPRR